jgi:hypothetical protein
VFDAAMLVGLFQFDREELLAGMLLFRVLYYLVPFIISVILLSLRELIVGLRAKRVAAALQRLDDAAKPNGSPGSAQGSQSPVS